MRPAAARPPGLAARLLAWLAPRAWRETLPGDLEEECRLRQAAGLPIRLWYWRQVGRVLLTRLSPRHLAREHEGPSMTQMFTDDLRAAWQQVRRQRRFALLVVFTLGTSLGSAAAVLGLVRAYLWTPLPYPDAVRLATVNVFTMDVPMPRHLNTMDWSVTRQVADLVVSWDIDGFTLLGGDRPETASGRWITADVFPMFGITPIAGRAFTREEERAGTPVAMIGHRLWQTRFAGSPGAIGQTLTIRSGDRPDRTATFTVVGVLPSRFWHLDDDTDLLLPLGDARAPSFVRLRAGVSPALAGERLTTLVREAGEGVDPAWRVDVQLAADTHVEPIRDLLVSIAVAVGLLVLVSGGNLVFLQMARSLARRRELAVRMAIGAGRARLVRQLGAEQVLLALGATVVACGVATALVTGVLPAVETYLGRLLPGGAIGRPDLAVVAAMAAAAFATCLASGLMPLAASQMRLGPEVSASAGHTMSRRRALARQAIVGMQIAATFALMAGAALVARSAWHLGRIDVGFDPIDVLSGNVMLHAQSYPAIADRQRAVRQILEETRRVPGVEAVGLVAGWPFQWSAGTPVRATGVPADGPPPVASRYAVSTGYFDAIGLRLIDGRTITDADATAPYHAAVVSESLANQLWPGRPAVGQTFQMVAPPPGTMVAPARRPTDDVLTVVGVVGNVSRSLTEARVPEVYVSLERAPSTFLFLQVRTRAGVPGVRPGVERAIAGVDPTLALGDVAGLEELVTAAGVQPRFLAAALGAFAGLSGIVAMVGVYAVSAWIARQRRREAALRIALGATPADVTRLFVRSGGLVVAAGLVFGVVPGLAIGRLLASQLHGVGPTDAGTFIPVAAVIGAVGLTAVWWPARRAGGVEPASALRTD